MNEPHNKLQTRVEAFLCKLGYHIHRPAYHDVMQSEVRELTSDRWNPTALYVRAAPDILAVHKTKDVTFGVDLKVSKSESKHDVLVEALPLAHHLMAYRNFGVMSSYIHLDVATSTHTCWWMDEVPPIDVIFMPDRWRNSKPHVYEYYRRVFNLVFPGIMIQELSGKNGWSDDPFVKINEEHKPAFTSASYVKRVSEWATEKERGKR